MKQYTLLTANGINKLLKTASNGSKIILKEVVVSDFDGELSENITTIPNEKYRGAINAITINESDSNILDVDAIIPPDVGGFYIKTAGIFCDDGSLFAVARLADTYKPLLSEGSSKDITLSFRLQIANANDSRKWSDATFLKKTDAYTKEQSDSKFAQINQIIGVNQTTKVVTAQRAFNTFYENTTEKPIMLYIDAWNNNTILQITLNVTIGNATLTSSNTATTTAATHTNITAPIPPKTRYIVTSNGALYSWVELS